MFKIQKDYSICKRYAYIIITVPSFFFRCASNSAKERGDIEQNKVMTSFEDIL